MAPINILPLDKNMERRRALAKVYSLLIKIAEEEEKKITEPLKSNIPQGKYNLPHDRMVERQRSG